MSTKAESQVEGGAVAEPEHGLRRPGSGVFAAYREATVDSAQGPGSPAKTTSQQARERLVELLREAAEIEHCLLDTYLFAACSLKSTPVELASVGGQANDRRGIQFELLRGWKLATLNVAHEEMLHLHYVQCLLRALGERPHFGLPERTDAGWRIPNFMPSEGDVKPNPDGVEVPVTAGTLAAFRRFFLYESSDAVQDLNSFDAEVRALFDELLDWELELYLEGLLLDVPGESERAAIKAGLKKAWQELPPVQAGIKAMPLAAPQLLELPSIKEMRFQSIADFYDLGILPLYQQAFKFGWVKHANRNLDNELQDPGYAAQGFLPIGPVARTQNFTQFSQRNSQDPLRNYKRVEDVIREIVQEGEGSKNFLTGAKQLVATLKEKGARAYQSALRANWNPLGKTPAPPWLQAGELTRQSHLYRFGIIVRGIAREQSLARAANVTFESERSVATLDGSVPFAKMVDELPLQFNACYLSMIAWLSRIYEVKDWIRDQEPRKSIEALASWPLMSLAIRPMLELASLFPIDQRRLFRFESGALPQLPNYAQQLLLIYQGSERSEAIDAQMDYLIMRTLTYVAIWAREQLEWIPGSALREDTKTLAIDRLTGLGRLDEFERQLPFREAGGYSNTMPDLGFMQRHKDWTKYEENPTMAYTNSQNQSSPIFQDALVLRLRFAGWGLVQLATDPDPPSDEVGCSGTQMLHAADGDKRFDRALVWQNRDPAKNIVRGPAGVLPELGVNGVDLTLLVTANGGATAGFVPLQTMSSSGAVQASGVQQDLRINGLVPLARFAPEDLLGKGATLRFDLLSKDGVRPFLNGENHLVWQDGEPVDPFILDVSVDVTKHPGSGKTVLRREIFNTNASASGKSMSILAMEPIQRIGTNRGPVGFDSSSNIPSWAFPGMGAKQLAVLQDPTFPQNMLSGRSQALATELAAALSRPDRSQSAVDDIASLADRMWRFSVPRSTTVMWPLYGLHYGHSLSGKQEPTAPDNPLLAALNERLRLTLTPNVQTDRSKPNGRWLTGYTQAYMDTDALTDFVYGELYVPLSITAAGEIPVSQGWSFPAGMKDALADYACRFGKPFWATPVRVDDKTRVFQAGDVTITEHLAGTPTPTGYDYTATFSDSKGADLVRNYKGRLSVEAGSDATTVVVRWSVSFQSPDPAAALRVLQIVAGGGAGMGSALANKFQPLPSVPAS